MAFTQQIWLVLDNIPCSFNSLEVLQGLFGKEAFELENEALLFLQESWKEDPVKRLNNSNEGVFFDE